MWMLLGLWQLLWMDVRSSSVRQWGDVHTVHTYGATCTFSAVASDLGTVGWVEVHSRTAVLWPRWAS